MSVLSFFVNTLNWCSCLIYRQAYHQISCSRVDVLLMMRNKKQKRYEKRKDKVLEKIQKKRKKERN